MLCHLCGQDVLPGQAFSRCLEPDYSREELELMGLGDVRHPRTCDAVTHLDCIETFSAPRQCCTPVAHPDDLCAHHVGLAPGFLCLDCRRWHQPECFAKEAYGSPELSIPQGLCIGCDRTMRLHLAMQDISDVPLETLEALAEVLRSLDTADSGHLAKILGLVRDLGEVRVPHAVKESVDTEVAVRALQRVLGTARRLQSGQEREFFELLSRASMEDEFRAQQAIPLEVAARNGTGRRSVVVTPDFAHRALPYLIFLDSRLGHSSEAKLTEDAEITAELNHMGYFVRRLRNAQLRPEIQAQTLQTLQRDLDRLRSDAVQKGFI